MLVPLYLVAIKVFGWTRGLVVAACSRTGETLAIRLTGCFGMRVGLTLLKVNIGLILAAAGLRVAFLTS
jgi:hypothetical protein